MQLRKKLKQTHNDVKLASTDTLQNSCRACLKKLKRGQKFKIQALDLELKSWLEEESVEDPSAMDVFPDSVCSSCKNKLRTFLKFRAMCAKSKKKILEIVGNRREENHVQVLKKVTVETEKEKKLQDEVVFIS